MQRQSPLRRFAGLAGLVLLASGCANPIAMGVTDLGRGNAPFMNGPGITPNRTPVDDALACYGMALRRAGRAGVSIGVGEVRDFTGRTTEAEGAQITQGGGLMVYSALGKLGGAVRIMERLDPRIGEVELVWTDRRQLGDGRRHRAQVGTQQQEVPWLPYFGGSILRSDYYIVGGITELNYTVSSGGFEAAINAIGVRARTFVVNVAADLRIVNTRTLVVERTITLQKQIIGYEAGVDIFRFFGTRLVDVNAGLRALEPAQLAVRAVLELATIELVEGVTGVDHRPCLPDVLRDPPEPSGSDQGGEAAAEANVRAEPYSVGAGAQPLAAAAASAPAPAAQAPAPAPPPRAAAAARPGVASAAAPDGVAGAPRPVVAPGVAAPQAPPAQPPGATAATPAEARPAPEPAARSEAPNPGSAPQAVAQGGGGEGTAPPAPEPPARAGVVLLAAMSSEDSARAAWTQALRRHPDLLGGLAASLRQVTQQDRLLWVVAVEANEARPPRALCAALRQRGADCVVPPAARAAARTDGQGG